MTDASPIVRPSETVLTAFRLLQRRAMWGEEGDVVLSREQWRQLYGFARRQAVATMLFDAVKSLPSGPDTELAAAWLLTVVNNERQYAATASVVRKMSAVWSGMGLDACVLKGLESAALYPVPEHRQCGDVDWYFPSQEQRCKANSWAMANGSGAGKDSDGCLHYSLGGVLMEHHLLRIDPSDKAQVLGMYIMHIQKHAMVMGIGFRHFCDVALAYRRFSGLYQPDALKETLSRGGALRWSALMDAFLVRELGLDERFLPFSDWRVVPDADVDRLLDLVIEDGNFGLQKKNRMSGFFRRFALFMRYSPSEFFRRWLFLAAGRMRIVFNR